MAYIVDVANGWDYLSYSNSARVVHGLYGNSNLEIRFQKNAEDLSDVEFTAVAQVGSPGGEYDPAVKSIWLYVRYDQQLEVTFHYQDSSGQDVDTTLPFPEVPDHGGVFQGELLNFQLDMFSALSVRRVGVSLRGIANLGVPTKVGISYFKASQVTTILGLVPEFSTSGDEQVTALTEVYKTLSADIALLSLLKKSTWVSGDTIKIYTDNIPESVPLPVLQITPVLSRDSALINQERLMAQVQLDVKIISANSVQEAADIYRRADFILTQPLEFNGAPDYFLGRYQRLRSFRYAEPQSKGMRYHVGGTYRCFIQQM